MAFSDGPPSANNSGRKITVYLGVCGEPLQISYAELHKVWEFTPEFDVDYVGDLERYDYADLTGREPRVTVSDLRYTVWESRGFWPEEIRFTALPLEEGFRRNILRRFFYADFSRSKVSEEKSTFGFRLRPALDQLQVLRELVDATEGPLQMSEPVCFFPSPRHTSAPFPSSSSSHHHHTGRSDDEYEEKATGEKRRRVCAQDSIRDPFYRITVEPGRHATEFWTMGEEDLCSWLWSGEYESNPYTVGFTFCRDTLEQVGLRTGTQLSRRRPDLNVWILHFLMQNRCVPPELVSSTFHDSFLEDICRELCGEEEGRNNLRQRMTFGTRSGEFTRSIASNLKFRAVGQLLSTMLRNPSVASNIMMSWYIPDKEREYDHIPDIVHPMLLAVEMVVDEVRRYEETRYTSHNEENLWTIQVVHMMLDWYEAVAKSEGCEKTQIGKIWRTKSEKENIEIFLDGTLALASHWALQTVADRILVIRQLWFS